MYRTLVSVEQLTSLMGSDNLAIVDCRFSLADPAAGARAYAEGHLAGATYADLNLDLSAPVEPGVTGRHPLPSPDAFAQKLGRWGISRGHQVVAYDDAGGAIAARLWWMLRWLGHDACAVLDGGLAAWTRAGQPLTAEVSKATATVFDAQPRPEAVVSSAEVAALLAAPGVRLLDAREPKRYRGEEEPIDPVAGHIPGAVSVPFADNLTPDKTFRAPAELRARFQAALAGVTPERCVAYCGSGVTACHDILAAEHAGLRGIKLYAGSWSEWVADNRRPVARGE